MCLKWGSGHGSIASATLTNLQISGIIWRQLSGEIKKLWELKAAEARRQHAEKYPTYRYAPDRLPQRNRGSAAEGQPIGRRGRKTDDPKEALQHEAIAAMIIEQTSCETEVNGAAGPDPEDSDLDGEKLMWGEYAYDL